MSEMMIETMFAIANMRRIIRVVISKKVKTCKTICKFEKFENTVNLIYTVCAMLEMMIWTIFAIVKMMRITEVVISNKPKRAEQTANSKSFKTL